jgi:succinoglycan biosynthesis transport protein ExoP
VSRINKAMQRAAQNDTGNATEPSDAPEAEDALFVAREDPGTDPELDGEPEPRPISSPEFGMLARKVPVQPLEMVRSERRQEIQLVDVVRILSRRRGLILAVVAISLGIAILYNWLATPMYQARAEVVIEPESQAAAPFQTGTENSATFDYFLTQLEILRSRTVAAKAMERLRLKQLPGELTVSPIRSDLGPSRVVSLSFVSADAVLAARIVNTLAETYVDQNLELRRQGNRDAAKWLDERLGELRKEVTASQAALQQYREQRDAVSLGGDQQNQNIVVQRLAQLSTNVTSARTERLAQEAVFDQLQSIEASGGPLDTLPPIAANSFIQGLKAELAGLQRERAQLAERLGELHPDMIKMDTAIDAAQGRLKAETDKVVASIRNDFSTAQARERALIAALDAQKREVLELNQQSIGYGALQRDAASTQQIFESVLQRLKETELSGELKANNVRIVDVADVPRVPIRPRKLVNLVVALLGGCFIAVALVFGLEWLNPRIAGPEHIAETLGLPLLGIAPRVDAFKKAYPVARQMPLAFHEALRAVRTRILLSHGDVVTTLAVTSTNAGEGKTVISSGLAISMAMSGRRVLLVDADMHRPQIHRVFDLRLSPGLANVLSGETKPSEALLKSEITGLFVLPAGAGVVSPSDLLDSERLTTLIDGFRKVFDIVVLDCPPVMALADASIMANAASSVLFVVGAGSPTREAARAALERLTSVQAHVIGAVLNKAQRDSQSAYYYSYSQSTEVA